MKTGSSLGATSGAASGGGGAYGPPGSANGHLPPVESVNPPVRTAVRVLLAVTGALILVYLASTIFRHHPGTIRLYDGWVGNLAYAGCAVVAVLRAATVRDRQRSGWTAIAIALVLFWLGNLLWTTVVQFIKPEPPVPSISDVPFLLMYPVAYLGVGLLVRHTLPPKGSRAVWLDGLVAALGVAALEAAIAITPIAHSDLGSGWAKIATNFAYPIGDLALVTMLVAVFAVQGWRVDRIWWTLAAGLVIFAFADTVYSVQNTAGTYQTGYPLDAVWMFGTFLIAYAAWQAPGLRGQQTADAQPAVVPGLFILTSLSMVVYATWHRVLPLAVVLATGALVAAVARTAHAYRQLRALAESRREARTDELTGLPNRRLFYETLRGCLEAGSGREQLAVLMIDLDRFKEINDSLGHHVGDEVLRQLGPRLASVVGKSGTVARLGGDEFGLLLAPLTEPRAATRMAERVRDVLRTHFLLETMTLRVDASIGIAIAPDHGSDADVLLQKADVAMYEAKHSHRSWEVYSSYRDGHTRERLELMEDVRDAIDRRELILYYQPKLDLATRVITGVEALVRWQHPVRGLLTPDRFLTLFEQSGLMGPLAMDVLSQAAAQQAEWARRQVDLTVAVNLSPANLTDEELPEKVAAVLDEMGVRPASVVLEITEDCLMDADHSRHVLDRLHALGVELSVDDYGTGFSSLAYLRDLPVSELKLDRAFLAAVTSGHDARAVAIIRSTIDLAHELDLRIVAEGVETDDALALIADLGCDAAQGYLLGRPAPAASLFDTERVPERRNGRKTASRRPR